MSIEIAQRGPFNLQYMDDGRVQMERGSRKKVFSGIGNVKKSLTDEIHSLSEIDNKQQIVARAIVLGGALIGARGIISHKASDALAGVMLVEIGIAALIRELPKEEIAFREAALEDIEADLKPTA
jgi:hypothetical protein